MSKIHANRGVERNKKPLQNIVYMIETHTKLKNTTSQEDLEKYEKYKFKDEYLVLNWGYQKELNRGDSWKFHGFVTPDELKERIGTSQWGKFCQGKREFVVQRRVDGKNAKK